MNDLGGSNIKTRPEKNGLKRLISRKKNLSNAGDWDEDALSFDWDVQQLNDWGLDLPDAGDEKQESEVKELKPYNKVHILISLSPDDFHLIQYYLDSIRETGVVEYEQSAN